MAKELNLNATEMEPPEPLMLTLDMLGELGTGDYLRFCHRREPLPLYDNLNQGGFSFITCTGHDVAFEVFIWRKNDEQAHSTIKNKIKHDKLEQIVSNLEN